MTSAVAIALSVLLGASVKTGTLSPTSDVSQTRVKATGSTTARALKDRFADVVNVKDFGAKGDGVTDDGGEIQAAFDAVPTGGGVVLFPPGTYYAFRPQFNVKNGTIVRGAGKAATVLVCDLAPSDTAFNIEDKWARFEKLKITSGAGKAIRFSGAASAFYSGIDDVELTNGTVGLEIVSTYGILVRELLLRRYEIGVKIHDDGVGVTRSSTAITFDHLDLEEYFTTTGVLISGHVTNVRFRDSIIEGGAVNTVPAVKIAATASDYPSAISFDKVWFETNNGYSNAVQLVSSGAKLPRAITIERCTFGGTWAAPLIDLGGSESVTIRNNYNVSETSAAFTTGGATRLRVSGNEGNSVTPTDDRTSTRITSSAGISPGTPAGASQSASLYFGATAPVSGTFVLGDRVINSAPTVGQPKGWVCTVAGTPGTWVSEGNL
jgi:hypothetical protein